MKSDKTTWPLFHCLEVAEQAKLMELQFNEYGYNLQVPPLPKDTINTEIESPDEIDKLMRKRPKHPKLVL